MTTNKTPIQEMIDSLDKQIEDGFRSDVSTVLFVFRQILNGQLQKEKAFAFDCFQAGEKHQMDCMLFSEYQEENTFDKFYSRYAEQHTK